MGFASFEFNLLLEPTEAQLNEMGREGWKVLAVIPESNLGGDSPRFLLERPLTDDAESDS